MRNGSVYAWAVALLCFLVLMIVTPAIPQSQEYHNFADHRTFFGIPNALNVISNFPFLVIGLIGLVLCHRGNYFRLRYSTVFVFSVVINFSLLAKMGILFVANTNTCAPKACKVNYGVGLASMSVWLQLQLDPHTTISSQMMLALFGIGCLFFDDLRPYALIQFVPCIAIPLMAIMLPPMYTHSTYWLWAAGSYLLAKVLEATDEVIYEWMHHIVSGHTLKHLFAAMVPVFLTFMLAKRTVEPERQSLLKTWRVSWTKFREGNSNAESYTYFYSNGTPERGGGGERGSDVVIGKAAKGDTVIGKAVATRAKREGCCNAAVIGDTARCDAATIGKTVTW
ncbi:hypothetical protein Fmac_010161 [Flemingia macrophylla]|uniref:Uncharacterized protein n=1 Tax=Flemingia macrophylla TaxID=520843 RepID=A0ABD1N2A6_9FABA